MVSKTVTLDNGTTITYDYSVLNKVLAGLKGKHTKIVADGVSYGVYWELGHTVGTSKLGRTVNRVLGIGVFGTMLQHPFMVPAVEKWRKPFQEALNKGKEDGYTKVSIDDIVDKVAHGIELAAKQEIEMAKDKGNGVTSDLVDTGALKNSIIVLDAEDI